MINLFSGAVWWDYSTYTKGYWTLQYEYQRNGLNMQYRFYWKLWLSSGAYFNDAVKLTIFIDGTPYDITVKGTGGGTGWSYEGTTGWYTVSNKTSGSTSFFGRVIDTSTGAVRGISDTYSLTVSPSMAIMSDTSDFNDEQDPTYSFSNPGGYLVEPYLEFLNADGSVGLTIAKYDGVSVPSGYVWPLSDAQRNQIRSYLNSRNSCKVNIGIRTTISGTYYYSALPRTFTIVIASPTLSATVVDNNQDTIDLTGDPATLIKYHSTALITITAAALKGASITRKVCNGTVVSGDTLSIANVVNTLFVITVIDSRGNEVILILNPVVIDYVPLTLSASLYRPAPTTGEVMLQFSGNWWNGNFGWLVNNLNVQWKYREKGATDWIDGGSWWQSDMTITDNTYSKEISLGTEFDYTKAFEFVLHFSDRLEFKNTGTDNPILVPKGKPVADWGEHDYNFNVPVTAPSITYPGDAINTDIPSGAYNNVSSISEYLRYLKYGKLVVIDIGGITFSNTGQGILFLSGLPIMKTRPVAFLSSDNLADTTKVCCYGSLDGTQIYAHVPSNTVKYYGQIIYLSDYTEVIE